MAGIQRRVATHYLAARAVLETAAAHAAELRAATAAARRAVSSEPRAIVIAHRLATNSVTLPFLDPVTGEPRPTDVTFRDSRAATATVARARPAGYLVPGLHDEALATLHLSGIAVCRLAEAADLAVDGFVVTERPPKVGPRGDQPGSIRESRDQAPAAFGSSRHTLCSDGSAGRHHGGDGAGARFAREPRRVGSIPLPAEASEVPISGRGRDRGAALPVETADGAICGR
jgi:hypothetical protein